MIGAAAGAEGDAMSYHDRYDDWGAELDDDDEEEVTVVEKPRVLEADLLRAIYLAALSRDPRLDDPEPS